MMQGTKKIAANTAFLYIRLIFVLIVSLFTVRIVLRSLGEIDYGIYNVVCGFVSMFGFFTTAMTNGVQRFYNYHIGKGTSGGVGTVYTSALYIQFGLAILIILLVEGIGLWYLNTQMVIPSAKLTAANWIFQFSLIGLLLTFIQIPYSAAVVAYEKMNFFALVGILDAIVKLVIAYGITLSPDRLITYGALLLIVNFLNFGLFCSYALKNFKELKLSKNRNIPMIKELLSFTGWNTFGSFAYVIRWQGINVLMNAFFGVMVNAANGIASQISSALAYFSGNLVLAFKPQLTQSYASGTYNRTRYLMFLMTKMSYALVYTLSVPIILEINYILNLWLGNNIPIHTSSFSILVIISVLLGCFHTPLTQIIHATGKIRYFQIITSIVITSILPLSWIGYYYGMNPNWAYWMTIIVYIVNQFVGMHLLRKQFEYSYSSYLKNVIFPTAIFTLLLPIMPYIIVHSMSASFLRLIIGCLTTLANAVILTYLIILSKEERKALSYKIIKIIQKH